MNSSSELTDVQREIFTNCCFFTGEYMLDVSKHADVFECSHLFGFYVAARNGVYYRHHWWFWLKVFQITG